MATTASRFILPPTASMPQFFAFTFISWLVQQVIMRFFGTILEPFFKKIQALGQKLAAN